MDIQKVVQGELFQSVTVGSCIVVGVSGGMDSLALLHVLQAVCVHEKLVIAHFDHGLRADARNDAKFVAETAVSLNLPFYLGQANVKEWAHVNSMSLEEAGRELRYRFLIETARKANASAIAVAHHADDQIETILMHLLRGSGLAGLRGMQTVRPFTDAPDLLLIRPFLSIRRSDIATYSALHHLQPIIDESNDDTTFFRNRIRHHLLPLLKVYSPQLNDRLRNLAEIVSADYDLLDAISTETWETFVIEQSSDWLTLDRLHWLSLPLSLQRIMLRKAVWTLRPLQREVGFQTIEQARLLIERNQTGALAMLPGGLQLLVGSRTIAIAADLSQLPIDLPQLGNSTSLHLPIPGNVELQNGWCIDASVAPQFDLKQIETNEDVWQAFVAVDNHSLIIRPRQPGERFQPLGMDGHSTKLKDVMKNIKLPFLLRDQWPIIATSEHIIWFVGHQIDDRVSVSSRSTRVVHLKCYHHQKP